MKTCRKTITYRDCCWLLLVVFVLQFGVAKALRAVYTGFLCEIPFSYLSILTTQLLAVGLPCLLLLFFRGVRPACFLRCTDGFVWSTAGISLLAGAAAQPVVSVIQLPFLTLVSRWKGIETEPLVSTPTNLHMLLVGLLIVAVLPAICEEFLMRGVVFSSLRSVGGLVSGIVTTILFALLHNDVAHFPVPILLGGLLCYITRMTDTVIYAMLAHGAFNATGMLTDYLFTSLEIDGRFYFAVAAVGIVVLYSTVSALYCRDSIVPRHRSHTVWRVLKLLANVPVLLLFIGYLVFSYMF